MPFACIQQIETQISADTITVKAGEILQAEGNVVDTYGTNSIKAEALIFDQKKNELRFNVKNFTGKSIRFLLMSWNSEKIFQA